MDKKFQELIYSFTHDLKSPMTGIIGNLELLLMKLRDDSCKKFADKALESSFKLFEQIEMFLDIFKYPSGQKEAEITTINVGEMFSEISEAYSYTLQRKNLDLQFVSECDNVETDKHILQNILKILISSSVTYSMHDSVIKVSFARGDVDSFILEVEDGGRSYPETPEELQLVFDIMEQETVKEKGLRTGKGYSFPYLKTVADTLGATVSFNNEPRATVRIRFKNG